MYKDVRFLIESRQPAYFNAIMQVNQHDAMPDYFEKISFGSKKKPFFSFFSSFFSYDVAS
eukprot:m.1652645 g.1652645  ORF g.1652645 m.1652645 type:complete len:60 (-) comp93916_c0_seq1:237-416(-)